MYTNKKSNEIKRNDNEITIIKNIQVTMVLKFTDKPDDAKVDKAVDKANAKLMKALDSVCDDVKIHNDKMFINFKDDIDNFTNDKDSD